MRAAITIDPHSTLPVQRQIYESWRDGILRGRFAAGMRLPSTRELASSLKVARSTVTLAYEQLVAEGYLQSQHGSGTFVCRELPDRLLHAPSVKSRSNSTALSLRLSDYGERLREDFAYQNRRAGFISFAHWSPDSQYFPVAVWRRLLLRQLRKEAADIFDYFDDVQGHVALRTEIAHYLSRSRAVNCTPDQVIVVNGSQQALDLCARVLLNPGDEVAFEEPGYLGSRRIFDAYGAQLQAATIDNEGIVCSTVSRKARAIYVTPSHQFPTGVAMSLQRRLELLAFARAHQTIIIEDDYDSEYRYSGAPLPALQGLVTNAPVIYCGSFSKVMFPGLRVGYLVAPTELIPALRRAKWLIDRNTPVLEQCALAEFLRDGHLERHIRRMRRLYGTRRQALIEAFKLHFGSRAQIVGDAAGMHAFVRIQDKQLMSRAEASKVILRPAAQYYLRSAPKHEYVFGFAGLSERAIREGIRRIAE